VRRSIKSTFAAVVLFFCLADSSAAGPFEDGLAAAERGDWATALRYWQPLADEGDAAAQNNLGVMYAKGQGVPQDYAEAVKWYRKSADQGNATAQYYLGVRYDNGQGVPQDYAEAAKWYRKSADQGNADAQLNLGVMYDNGQGVPQEDAEAVKWYRKSADQGNASAQYNLGGMYWGGRGVAEDYPEAHKWLNLAAAQGYKDAKKYRDRLAELMTVDEIANAQRLARESSRENIEPGEQCGSVDGLRRGGELVAQARGVVPQERRAG
jgi:TPR repeat protein